MSLELKLDHVGVAVEDLDAVYETYSKLGFRLTPRSVHSGSHVPGGPVKPLGSANHCAMFQDGYLELLGVVDASLPNHASPFLEKYQGIHIVAFGLEGAEAARAELASRTLGVQEISMLERDATFGPDNDQIRRARFANIYLDEGVMPEAYFIFIEHLTRDVLWQPHLLDHPNGAVAMQEVVFCVPDAGESAARFAKLLGVPADEKMPGIYALDLPRGRLYIMSEAGMDAWAPGVKAPHMPFVAGFGVTVNDLEKTKALLDANAVPFNSHPYPAIWIEPEQTMGPVVSFIQG
jgi:catechol 2,3-dioxygenase-like lactoylglutathione lyase family enzyme